MISWATSREARSAVSEARRHVGEALSEPGTEHPVDQRCQPTLEDELGVVAGRTRSERREHVSPRAPQQTHREVDAVLDQPAVLVHPDRLALADREPREQPHLHDDRCSDLPRGPARDREGVPLGVRVDVGHDAPDDLRRYVDRQCRAGLHHRLLPMRLPVRLRARGWRRRRSGPGRCRSGSPQVADCP